MSRARYFEVPVEVFYASDDPLTLLHAWAGTQREGISFFPRSDACVRFMRIAPGCTSVNKRFILSGNIRPIRRRDGYDNVRGIKFMDDAANHIRVVHHARSGFVAGSAPPAECEIIIIDADTLDVISGRKFFADDFYDLRRSAGFYRAAVYNKRSHTQLPFLNTLVIYHVITGHIVCPTKPKSSCLEDQKVLLQSSELQRSLWSFWLPPDFCIRFLFAEGYSFDYLLWYYPIIFHE